MSAVAAPPSPYKGLAPFEDSKLDALLFFGREREIEVIVANLMAARLTVLYGVSGVGKTSLLRAGVAHRLRQTPKTVVVVFSTWAGDPVGGLLDAVEAAAVDAPPMRRGGSLADVLSAWTRRTDVDLYVVLDQLEEYFLYHEDEQGPGTLAHELPEAVRRPALRANFLFSIREDSLARLDAFKARIPNLFGNSLRLDRLDREAARAAIVGPLERYNELVPAEERFEAEPELVEAVLTEVAAGRVDLGLAGRGGLEEREDADRIEAPYLQLVLERLWEVETARGSRQLRLATLRELGGAAQIVEDHLERAMSELSAEEKDTAAAIYNHLVTPSGTKIAHRAGDLAGYASVDETETERVLQRLVEERIVRAGEDGAAGPRYEIFHDVLAEAVLAWRAQHEAARELEAERRAAARRHRRMLVFAIIAAVLVAVLAAIAIFALAQRSDARKEARKARGRELAALASTAAPNDPDRSVRLALKAAEFDRSPAIADVLRSTLRGLRVRAVLPAGGRPVTDVDFSPDGKLLVTAGEDGRARIYRTLSGGQSRTLHHGAALAAAVFSPDGKEIVTAGRDGVARVWSVTTGTLLHAVRHRGPVTSAIFSRDALATTSEDGTVGLWDARSGALLHRLSVGAPVRSASFNGEGTLLVVVLAPAARDRTARVYDVASGQLVEQLVQPARVTSARFAPTGPLVVTGGSDSVARVWDVRSGLEFREPVILPIHELSGHSRPILDAEFSPSDGEIVTASMDKTARVWRTPTGALLGVLPGHRNDVLRAVFSPDGGTVATASSDRMARVFLANGALRVTLVGHRDSVTDVAFSRDGKSVATASADGTARLWDRRPQPDLKLVGRQGAPVADVAFSADGRRVVSAGANGSVRTWRLGRPRPPVHSFRHAGGTTRAVALSSDGRRVAIGIRGAVRIYDADSGRLRRTIRTPGSAAALALSADGTELADVGRDRSVRVWSTETGSRSRTIRRPGSRVVATSFSPDGTKLVTAGLDAVARIWDARSGKLVARPLVGHKKPLTSAEFSPDGRYVATTSLDRDARVWDARTGKLMWTLRGHSDIVNDASFSADSRWVVTAGPGVAGVWDMSSGRQLFGLNGRDRRLTAVAFSPRGWRIVTGGVAHTVKTYDCRLCGGVDDLVDLARLRLAHLRH
jgi:WD40 repeat protein